jgi:alkylation response protein AidB-like acyl-CoA dehydrogenase
LNSFTGDSEQIGRSGASTLARVAWAALTDEQREIRELVRTLARERVAPRTAEIDESHEFPWDVVELFREHDLFGLLFDEEWGGSGTGTFLALFAT